MSSDIIKRLKNAWVILPISVRKSAAESAVAQLFWQSLGNGGRLIFPTLCVEEIAEPLPKNIATIA